MGLSILGGNQPGVRRPPGVIDVRHHQAACRVYRLRQPPQTGEGGVGVDSQLRGNFPTVGLHVHGLGYHQSHSSLRPADIEGNVLIGYFSRLCGVAQFNGGHHYAVGQGQASQLKWLQHLFTHCVSFFLRTFCDSASSATGSL